MLARVTGVGEARQSVSGSVVLLRVGGSARQSVLGSVASYERRQIQFGTLCRCGLGGGRWGARHVYCDVWTVAMVATSAQLRALDRV